MLDFDPWLGLLGPRGKRHQSRAQRRQHRVDALVDRLGLAIEPAPTRLAVHAPTVRALLCLPAHTAHTRGSQSRRLAGMPRVPCAIHARDDMRKTPHTRTAQTAQNVCRHAMYKRAALPSTMLSSGRAQLSHGPGQNPGQSPHPPKSGGLSPCW